MNIDVNVTVGGDLNKLRRDFEEVKKLVHMLADEAIHELDLKLPLEEKRGQRYWQRKRHRWIL